jgi:hypothetical protein
LKKGDEKKSENMTEKGRKRKEKGTIYVGYRVK